MNQADSEKTVYRVLFYQENSLYEVYVKKLFQSELYGFVELEDFIFGERSQVVVDPSEERLKTEFSGVARSYVPMHSILRIDEVDQQGISKVKDFDGKNNVSTFPGNLHLAKPRVSKD